MCYKLSARQLVQGDYRQKGLDKHSSFIDDFKIIDLRHY